ncbi:uncharacterized protein BT62DRAFT_552801 [Guyanagaster necrorhizus]|uniref:GST N-terminal domain-containing protein n=1 Tax=Guyanagaster necrorhizus TaxID=856835 RepID=A0A9P7VJN0_9AGAR|nr:uncharacterized protein BT62DRAFT_552801 [Guyanagaster necrorhizus MCA 3950]KAG7441164.1 hypothetical protein BT62DRAFT_552801 [Guyanagaster necrorhizus MCA 3950]
MITLYDLPTKAADSPGTMMTWRTRYALNLKSLPYRTVYVELPDVEALAKKIGAAPTTTKPDGVSPFYTIPIIQDDSTGTVVSDSPAIAAYLDKTYPDSGPILIPTGTMTLQLAFSSAVVDAFAPLRPFYAPGLTTKMNEATAAYFLKRFGGAVKIEMPKGEEREKLLVQAKENFGKMNKWFEGSEGDFVMGNEPCFADTAICAFLWFTRRMVGEESEEWKDVVSWNDGRWGRYLESFKPYEKLL